MVKNKIMDKETRIKVEKLQSLNRIMEKTNEVLYRMLVEVRDENEKLRAEVADLKTQLKTFAAPIDTRPDWMKKTDD